MFAAKISEKKNKKVRSGKSGVRHMGETGGWAKVHSWELALEEELDE